MVFSHDAEVSLACVVDLINAGEGSLRTVDDLDAFLLEWRFSGSRTNDEAELADVLALQPRLRQIWTSSRDEAVPHINQLLADGDARPFLVRHDEWDWHLHATSADQPLHLRIAVEAAMALVDVIRQGEWERLRTCSADDCSNVLIDLSRNRSRRYCDAGCGNRLNVAAYRARVADA